MRTKTAEPRTSHGRSGASSLPPAPSIPDTVAYWLENWPDHRVTKLFRAGDTPMVLAGRALEHLGHLDGWSLVRRDRSGGRHVIASGPALAALAEPFMPERTPDEVAALAPYFAALRSDPAEPSTDPEITDERVY